jgi:hypothetical protein
MYNANRQHAVLIDHPGINPLFSAKNFAWKKQPQLPPPKWAALGGRRELASPKRQHQHQQQQRRQQQQFPSPSSYPLDDAVAEKTPSA